jgi:lysophospholipase L1-like esterase
MKTAILLLLGAGLLSGCSAGSEAQTTMTSEKQFTFLALGDSYTIGQGVADPERWPVKLAAALRAQGIPMGEPAIIARTGWTTGELLAAIENQPSQTYDLVGVLIGVNDQFRGHPIAQYQEEFGTLLTAAIAAAGRSEHVIVLSIPDWGVTPFAEGADRANIAAQIDAFNAVNRAESLAAGVQYFDITPSTRPPVMDASMLAEDGLHPGGEMYALWVEQMLPYLVELFRN